jgi:hypothetical protein
VGVVVGVGVVGGDDGELLEGGRVDGPTVDLDRLDRR